MVKAINIPPTTNFTKCLSIKVNDSSTFSIEQSENQIKFWQSRIQEKIIKEL